MHAQPQFPADARRVTSYRAFGPTVSRTHDTTAPSWSCPSSVCPYSAQSHARTQNDPCETPFTALKCLKSSKLFPSAGRLFRSLDQEAKLLNQYQREGLAFSEHFRRICSSWSRRPTYGCSANPIRTPESTTKRFATHATGCGVYRNPSPSARFDPGSFQPKEHMKSTQQRRRS